MRIRFSLLLFFTICFTTVSAQSDFRMGYYITLSDDTIYGLVDYRGEIRNSKICIFKLNDDTETKKFEPGEIKAYRFINSKFYITKTVKTQNEEQLLFVEYLLNGITDLFYYKDVIGDHYLIETKEGELVELKSKKEIFHMEGKGLVSKKNNKYIGILKVIFSDCMEIQSKIEKTKLTHKSLIELTKNYHDYVCDGEKCIIYEKKLPFVKVNLAPSVGLGISNLNIKNSILSFDNSFNLIGGLSINTSLPRANEKISFLLDMQINKNYFYSFYNDGNDYLDIHIRPVFIQSSFGFKYTYPKGKLKPTLAIGGSLTNCLNTKIKVVEEVIHTSTVETDENSEFPFPSKFLGGFAQIGCDYMFSKKWIGFFNVKYYYNTNYTDDKYNGKVIIQSYNLNIGLYF